MIEKTFSMVKPDGVKNNHIGAILNRFEQNGLKIIALKMTNFKKEQAQEFYGVHKERPFFGSLVNYICSGPLVAVILEGEDAVKKCREIMGATDPAKAAPGTIRKDFAESIEANAVHGSDSTENAEKEISFFLKEMA